MMDEFTTLILLIRNIIDVYIYAQICQIVIKYELVLLKITLFVYQKQ